MPAADFDVVIVGGGLVGCSLAMALAAQGRRVGLIETQMPRAMPPGWDERCIALNAASIQILERYGVWEALAAQASPITATHISERGRFGATRFTAAEAGLPALGYNTPLRAINQVLWARMEQTGVAVFCPASLQRFELDQSGVQIALDTPEHPPLHTQLLVAADGARSAVRKQLGLSARTHDYGQSAIVTAIRPQYPHDGVAYERFLPGGPLAILPKPDDDQGHACSLVWTVPSSELPDWMGLDDAAFLARAQDRFGERLGRLLALGQRHSYPLQRVMSDALTAPRTVLVGNAAQSLHPVAAQGFNLGLRDVAALAEVLRGAADAGHASLLSDYAARRRQDRQRASDFTDRLVRLFSNTVPGLRQLRHLGLLALELDTPARQAILQQNLGLATALPEDLFRS
ncbi:2-octaprenyl-6-methoxyphenyl hydroxylase [Panacagrimonas sp.]|uniref:2-octaprenyl-6-methoxyphenyl hydroxylase n=1 Tax=Panacagrimonas sp. TaxID=2480088 RepID=UPI003B527B70